MEAEPPLIALVLLAAPFVGCIADPTGGSAHPVAFDRLEQGQASGIEEQRTEVVRNQSAWQALWLEHQPGDGANGSNAPAVDFEERIVLAAFMGQRPNACHTAEIENVTRTDDGRLLVEGAWVKVQAAACAEVLTAPYDIATVSAHEGEVVFDMEERNVTPEDDAGDGSDPGGSSGDGTGEDRSVSNETVEQGSLSGIEDERHVVVRDEATWEALWANHTRGEENATPPAVDFEESTVVALFKGQSPNTCHAVHVIDLVEDGEDLIVNATYVTEGDEMACGMQVTYPFHIVTVPRVDGDVTFDITTEGR